MVDFHERWRGLRNEMGVFGGVSRRLRSVLTELIGPLCGTTRLTCPAGAGSYDSGKAYMPAGSGAAPGLASAERRPSIRRLRERQDGSYHTSEGHRGHDLVCRASPQQRLDPFQVVQHFRQLIRSLPVVVVRPAGQPSPRQHRLCWLMRGSQSPMPWEYASPEE